MSFRKLIRNLRIEHELEEFCKKKGINKVLAKRIGFCMFVDMSNLEIAQKHGLHLTTVKFYRIVLGSLEESKFNQIVKLPIITDYLKTQKKEENENK